MNTQPDFLGCSRHTPLFQRTNSLSTLSRYNEMEVTTPDRRQALLDALESRILIIDGAMGTMIHQEPLSIETDFLGRENCPEILVVTRPDLIKGIHCAYLEAGADIVETDTFGGTSVVLAEFNLQDRTHELNVAAARLAREAADELSIPGKPRFVAGSRGPTTKDLNITSTITFEKLSDNYS